MHENYLVIKMQINEATVNQKEQIIVKTKHLVKDVDEKIEKYKKSLIQSRKVAGEMDSEKIVISGTNGMDNVTVNLDKTPEKYRSNAEQVVPDFVELFRKYTKVTGIYMKQRNELIKQHKGVVRTAENWNDFDEYYACMDKLENDCRKDKMELLGEYITDNIYVTKFDLYPSRFDYFNTGCRIDFIMKSEKKITLDAIFNSEDYERHRFILRKQDNNWKIDWFGYSYEEEGYLRKDDL